jgi:hypothetical protein
MSCPLLAAQRYRNPRGSKHIGEPLLAGDAGSLPRQALDAVVGDEIDVRVEVAGDVAQVLGLLEGVVDLLMRMNSRVTMRPCFSEKVRMAGSSLASG